MKNRVILAEEIKEIADLSGIDALGYAAAYEFLGYALKNSKRRDPKLSLLDAKTIIVAGIYIGGLTLPAWSNPWYGRTSRLYLSSYFSDVIEPLRPIACFLIDKGYKAIICDSSTDKGSIVPLKLAAVRAGLGWQGKNSLLVTKKFGTFLALGGIVTNAIIEHNVEEKPNLCIKCNKCREACPVSALEQPYLLSRQKCISNNLLYAKQLPKQVLSSMENRIGDCEICQQACPWNKKHIDEPLETRLTRAFKDKIKTWEKVFYLPDLENMTEEEYKEVFAPFKTDIPYEIFHRNVSIAIERARRMNV